MMCVPTASPISLLSAPPLVMLCHTTFFFFCFSNTFSSQGLCTFCFLCLKHNLMGYCCLFPLLHLFFLIRVDLTSTETHTLSSLIPDNIFVIQLFFLKPLLLLETLVIDFLFSHLYQNVHVRGTGCSVFCIDVSRTWSRASNMWYMLFH